MKVEAAKTGKVAEAVGDGFADRFGYACEFTPEPPGCAHEAGGFRKKSGLEGVRLFDGKPYTGKDNS